LAYAPGPMSGRTHNVEDAPRALARVQALVDRPVRVAAVGLVIAIGIVLTLALARGTGISGFVHAAPPYTDPAAAPDSLNVLPPGQGFDGQFFYRVAVAPYSKADQVAGVTFDLPTLRQQRIGYPLLASAVSLGGRDRVPLALIVVNLGALFALGWLGAKLALDSGRMPAWGLLFAVYPGFVYSLGFDTSEIVTATFLIAALLAIRRERTALAILAVAAAVLTRETALILPMALVFAGAWPWWRGSDRTDRRTALTVGLAGIGVFVSWELFLRWSWGSFALTDSGNHNVDFPLSGLVDQIDRFLPPTSRAAGLRDISLGFLVLMIVLTATTLARSPARRHEKVGFVLAAALLPLLSEVIWIGATSFMRASTEVYVFSVVVLMASRIRVGRLVGWSTAAVVSATIVSEVVKAG
jgi:hypothetical protein